MRVTVLRLSVSYLIKIGENKAGVQIDPLIVYREAVKSGIFGGIGIYNDFNHVDLRPKGPNGKISRWNRRRLE